jgi:cellulose synthase/poly-beta-1,6-N-acetylglucosamine synthase-like glycosyltransferase
MLFYWSIATVICVALLALQLARGARSIAILKDVQLPQPPQTWPTVSIIVPARNEERDLVEALSSLLNQDYPALEVLVVNDRSTDHTGEILADFANRYPDLQVVHVTELPEGWLGKNHALYRGAQQAKGQLLLLTDADVVMHPSAVRRGVAYLQDQRIDHLAMTPVVQMPTPLLEAFVVTFMIFFSAYVRPWKVRDPNSSAHIGIGAFNLIRAEVYQAIGTHVAIRMRPDDDLKLGKLVKVHGHRQDVVQGRGLIQVRWYHSFGELVEGLMKNAYSGADYRLSLVVLATLVTLGFLAWPFIAIFCTTGPAQLLYAAAVAMLLLTFVDAARSIDARWWLAPLFPCCALLFVYIQWRAVYLTYRTGGITWRGTHYPLAELRANKL